MTVETIETEEIVEDATRLANDVEALIRKLSKSTLVAGTDLGIAALKSAVEALNGSSATLNEGVAKLERYAEKLQESSAA